MASCFESFIEGWTRNCIRNYNKYKFKKLNNAEELFKKDLETLCNKIVEDPNVSESLDQTSNIMSNLLEAAKINPGVYTSAYIKEYLFNKISGVETAPDISEVSTDRIFDPASTRKEVSKKFLTDAYGEAVQIQTYVENETSRDLFDCLFVNRDPNKGRTGSVDTTTDLNNNMRNYKESLFAKIINYLRILTQNEDFAISPELKKLVNGECKLFNSNNKGTNNFNALSEMIGRVLNFKPAYLQELYRRMNDSQISQNERNQATREFEAYNAKIMLANIDTYIALILPKTVRIKTFNKFTGEDNYAISDKTAQIFTTWRRVEDINPENEADTITKLAINTTRIYSWQSGEPISGRYMTFQDFEYIIGKIKKIAFDANAQKLIFDSRYWRNNKSLFESLSKETKEYLTNKSLSDAIGIANDNARLYYPMLFELFTNQDFYNLVKDNIMSKQSFRPDELNKLQSLGKEIFCGEYSIRNLSNPQNVDYFSYITQTALSICDSSKIQIYRNPDNQFELRSLKYASVYNIQRKIENKIDVRNGFLSTKFEDFVNQYKIEPINDSNGNIWGISFSLNGETIKVDIKIGSVKGFTSGNIQFIEEMLGIDLTNTDFKNALINEFSNENLMIRNLFTFASRVLANRYISHEFFESGNLSKKAIDNQLKAIFGDKNVPRYNYTLRALGKVSRLDIPFLSAIARAQANIQGILTAVSAKDSEGNGQSLVTLSRLIGNVMTQISLQEKLPESITRDCILLKPGMLEDAVTVTEYYDGNGKITKSAISLNPTEMVTSQLLGYEMGLSVTDANRYVGNGHVVFYTSVNSDKPQLTAIKVNLNTEVEVDGKMVPLRQLTEGQLYKIISHDFNIIHSRMIYNINQDLEKVEELLPKEFISTLNLNNDFNDFNDTFYNILRDRNRSHEVSFARTPSEFIKLKVLEYNEANPNNRIELVDQLHFIIDRNGNLHSNLSLISQSEIFENSEVCKKFFKLKEKHMLIELLKQGVNINISDNTEIEERIQSQYSDWIDQSGDLILGKIHINNTIQNLTIKSLIYEDIDSIQEKLNNNDYELNPLIKKYNLLDFLVTQEFMYSTVGTYLAHPSKSKSGDYIEDMASRVNAQNKRNVSITATMHPFEFGTLDGGTTTYKVATVEDIFDKQGTVLGELSIIAAFDGATFVDPCTVILENNSLKGAKAGITKKQFVHFKDPRLGYAGIIKTAGFGLTNDWIRNSEFLQRLSKKMMNRIWLNEDGSVFTDNILINYNGEATQIGDIYYKTPEDGKYWHILEYSYDVNTNLYTKTVEEVNQFGESNGSPLSISSAPIRTNYELWQFLGGWNSVSFKENGKQLVYSNTSIETVVRIMNQVGTRRRPGKIETQEDVYQPLKHSNINYTCTRGAIKQGAANINPISRLTDKNNSIALDFQEIKMYQTGIQLNKEHQADEGELSLLTQLVNACNVQGFSFDASTAILNALRVVSEQSTKDVYDAFIELGITGKRESMRGFLTETIVKILANGQVNSNNFASILAEEVIDKVKKGENVDFKAIKFPFSDRTVFAKVLSSVTSFLTRSGIKQKIPGLLSVLTPSYNIFKLYGGRKLESFKDPKHELEELQKIVSPAYDISDPTTSLSRIRLGRDYIIQRTDGTSVTQPINTPQDYWNLIDNSSDIVSVTEDIRNGRELASFNVRIPTKNGEFQIWDLDSFRASYELNDAIKNYKKTGSRIGLLDFAWKYFGIGVSPKVSQVANSILYDSQGELSDLEKAQALEISKFSGLISKDGGINITNAVFKTTKNNIVNYLQEVLENKKLGHPTDNVDTYFLKFKEDDKVYQSQEFEEPLTKAQISKLEFIYNSDGLDPQQYWSKNKTAENILLEYSRSVKYENGKAVSSYDKSDLLGNTNFPSYVPNIYDEVSPDNLTILVNRWKQRDLINLSSQSRRDYLQQFIEFEKLRTEDSKQFFKKINQWLNIALANGQGKSYKGTTITAENYDSLRDSIINDLLELNRISIRGIKLDIDPVGVQMEPYEAIAPKIFKTEFGLKEHDDLFEISRDRDFFTKRMVENISTKINFNLFQIELKKSDGKHIYLTNTSDQIQSHDFHKVEIFTINENGKTYRTDEQGNILYELYNDENNKLDFEVYQDSQGNEIIVSKNYMFYVNNLDYNYIQLSKNIAPGVLEFILQNFKENNDSAQVSEFLNQISRAKNTQEILKINNNLSNNTSYLRRLGRRKHAAFLKQLEVIVGRIPGQGLQSFMPMQIVAFDNPDINTLHVSTMQLLLQGSDYDIDAASIVTYDVDMNGLIPLWSPYAIYDSLETLNNVMELPFPTGKKVTVLKYNEDELINDSAFAKFIQAINPILIIDEQGVKLKRNINSKKEVTALSYLINQLSNTKFPGNNTTFHEILGVDINPDIFIEQLSEIVDKHNLYFDKCSKRKIVRIANNYSMYNLYKVNTNPAHLIQAGTSVDGLTGKLKAKADESPDANDIKTRTVGDFVARAISIMDNQVGRMDVGIAANGLKAFFNSTQYLNNIINNGTEKQQDSIVFNIPIMEKNYRLFANLWPKNINTVKSQKLLDALSEVTQDEDSALLLSAALSLSVDNAKELKIAYLNASPETMGMYLAGLMIGVDFNTIADIFMSDVGKMLKRRIQSNVFTREWGENKFSNNLFKFFKDPFKVISQKFNQIDTSDSLTETPVTRLGIILKIDRNSFDTNRELLNSYKDLVQNKPLSERIKILEGIRSRGSGKKWNQLIDFLEQYEYDKQIIRDNKQIYDSIKNLAECQNEIQLLGRILSLNQGLKTNLDDMQNLIRSIETCISGQRIDLIRFFHDENYANECVKEYGKWKICINILGLMKNVPHVNKYAQILAMAKAAMNESFIYRSVNSILEGYTFQSDRVVKGVQNFVNDTIIDNWLLTQGRDTPIIIPKGVIAYDKNGSPFELKEDTAIQLGTDWGNATFRSWMETRVIPDLQKGIIQPGIKGHLIKDNIFVRDLTPDILTSYITRNESIVYTLPINMIPKTDNESILLNNYREAFSKITSYSYKYNANEKVQSAPLLDLFTYYTMISFRWRNGENSLVPIFAKFINSDKLTSYRDYIVALDRSSNTLIYDKVQYDVSPYTIPFESPWSTKSKIIYYKNRSTRKYEVMVKRGNNKTNNDEDSPLDYEGEMDEDIMTINGFSFQIATVDYNMFPKGEINSNLSHTYILNYNNTSYQITYDKETETITQATEDRIQLKELTNAKMPFIIRDGVRVIDTEQLQEMIDTTKNCF